MAKQERPRHPSRRRLREVDLIAQARFSCSFGPADAYLSVLEHAPRWERVDLFARILVMHNNMPPNGQMDARTVGDHHALLIYVHRYVKRVDRFQRRIRRDQLCLHHSALVLWRWLLSIESRERRLAAFTLVLHRLTPMADLRTDLLYDGDRDVLLRMPTTWPIRQAIAELQRLLKEGQDAVDAASVVLGLLDELPDDVRRTTFLSEVLTSITRPGQRRPTLVVIPLHKVEPLQAASVVCVRTAVPNPSVN